jgi:hypothetical protein
VALRKDPLFPAGLPEPAAVQALIPTDGAADTVQLSAPALAAGMYLLARSAGAAEPEPLDEEFLEYLSQLESDDDDWTLFEADAGTAAPAPPAAKPVASPTASPTASPAASKEPSRKSPPAKAQAEVVR